MQPAPRRGGQVRRAASTARAAPSASRRSASQASTSPRRASGRSRPPSWSRGAPRPRRLRARSSPSSTATTPRAPSSPSATPSTSAAVVSRSSGSSRPPRPPARAPRTLIPLDTAQAIAGIEGQVSTVYVQAESRPGRRRAGRPRGRSRGHRDDAGGPAGTVSGCSASSLISSLGTWLSIAVLAAAFLIAILFTVSASPGTREFGTLKAMAGATAGSSGRSASRPPPGRLRRGGRRDRADRDPRRDPRLHDLRREHGDRRPGGGDSSAADGRGRLPGGDELAGIGAARRSSSRPRSRPHVKPRRRRPRDPGGGARLRDRRVAGRAPAARRGAADHRLTPSS